MQKNVSKPTIHLHIPATRSFLPLVLGFVREGVQAFSYGQVETDALTLAAEEICGYLMNLQQPSDTIDLSLTDGNWRLVLRIDCKSADMDLRAFNLTWRIADDEESLDHMGLLLASRMVDRMTISSHKDRMQLCLVKHRAYPPVELPEADPAPPPDGYRLIENPSSEVFQYALLQLQAHGIAPLPSCFRNPLLAADMLAAGDMDATLACNAGGAVLGMACRRWMSPRCVELLGPYLLIDGDIGETIRTELVEDSLGRAARTQAVGMICRHTQQAFTRHLFDTLGTIPETQADGITTLRPVYYRLLREDDGRTVYADSILKPFLEAAWERLTLPRILRRLPHSGGRGSVHSVLEVEFERDASRCTLRLLQIGKDLEDNVKDHLRILRQEGIRNIVYEMDLGNTADAAQASVLVASGFRPRLLIPDGGQGDLLLFTADMQEGQ